MLKSEMSFLGHLSELRNHLWRMVIAITISAIFIGFNIQFVMDYIFLAPSKNQFITFKYLNFITNLLGLDNKISMPDRFPIQVRKMFEQVNVAVFISITGGIVISFPYLIFEIWKFISPALTLKEKKKSILFVFSIVFFFLLGILFGYFIISPISIYFGYFFNISGEGGIITNIDLSNYIDTIIYICFGMGILFLMPIIAQFLTQIKVITPKFLKTYRKHSIVVILILSALITPPDSISMVLAAFPLFLLYELSVFFSVITYKQILKSR